MPGRRSRPFASPRALADHRHVAFDDGAALGAELLGDLLLGSSAAPPLPGRLGDAVDMAADRADERDAHHAGFELRRRRMPLGDREGVDDVEVDLLVADGLARMRRQLLPDLERRRCDCRMNVPPSTSPRSGLVWLNTLWSGETTISTSSSSALVIFTGSGLRVM